MTYLVNHGREDAMRIAPPRLRISEAIGTSALAHVMAFVAIVMAFALTSCANSSDYDAIVAFDSKCDAGAVTQTASAVGDEVTVPQPPDNSGYAFVGWYAGPADAHWVQPGEQITAVPGEHYHAVWAPTSIEVTFAANGGEGVQRAIIADVEASEADAFAKATLPNPSIEAPAGCRFAGWESVDGAGGLVQPGEVVHVRPRLVYGDGLEVDRAVNANTAFRATWTRSCCRN